MRLLFWLLIFDYYAKIYAPWNEDPVDYWRFTKKLAASEDRREPGPYDALLMITEENGTIFHLPEEVQVTNNNQQLASKGRSSPTSQQTFGLVFLRMHHKDAIEFLCSVDVQHDVEHERVIEKSKKYYSGYEYCLIKAEFPPSQEVTCPSEAIPLLVPMMSDDIDTVETCGPKKQYDFLRFAYPYCHSISTIEKSLKRLERSGKTPPDDDEKPLFSADHPMLELYRICFNTKDVKVVYTHHRIFPSLVKNANRLPNLNPVDISSGNALNSKFYHEKFHRYSRTKNAFADQTTAHPYRMHPQMFVPTADMPFTLWKKSTFSYINIAPLWENLVPLMDLINDRIRQLAIKRSKKLSVYSAAFDVRFDAYHKLYVDKGKRLAIPTIWGKLVHDEESETATVILLHNTPDHDFKSSRLCATSEEVTCNFTDWWRTSSQKDIIDKTAIEETAQYAYCCQVRTTNIIPEYYGIPDIKIKGDIVNIDK